MTNANGELAYIAELTETVDDYCRERGGSLVSRQAIGVIAVLGSELFKLQSQLAPVTNIVNISDSKPDYELMWKKLHKFIDNAKLNYVADINFYYKLEELMRTVEEAEQKGVLSI